MSIYIPGAGISIPSSDYTLPPGNYEGVILNRIPDGLLKFSKSAVAYVSGTGGNPFGHAAFMINASIGYVHSCEPGVHPARFIPHDEWDRFLQENNKVNWKMLHVKLPNKAAAANYVVSCMLNGFNWQPFHNCVTLCDQIIAAAGGQIRPNSIFPSTATQQPGTITQPKFKHPWDAIGDGDL